MNRTSFAAMPGDIVTVNSRKYDGRVRRTWTGGVVSQNDEMLVVVGRFEANVDHTDLGHIAAGTVSFEHFWLDRWYNIFRFHEPDGRLKAWYCNVAMPPTLADGVLDFVDLDIDVVVWPDMRLEVVDLDDFEENSLKFGYPPDVIDSAKGAVKEIIHLVETRGLPAAT